MLLAHTYCLKPSHGNPPGHCFSVPEAIRQRLHKLAHLMSVAGAPPPLVSVSSLLWDLARLSRHEQAAVASPVLSPALVNSWMANFTAVIGHARTTFPTVSHGAQDACYSSAGYGLNVPCDSRPRVQVMAWATHTILPPKHGDLGKALKPYLGHRYHISQLNTAVRHVADQLQLQLVDIDQVRKVRQVCLKPFVLFCFDTVHTMHSS